MPDKIVFGQSSILFVDPEDVAFSDSFVWALCEVIIAKGYDKWDSSCRCTRHGVVAVMCYSNLWLHQMCKVTADNKRGNDIQLIIHC